MTQREKRVHFRQSLETEGWIFDPSGKSSQEVKLLDISMGGIAFLSPAPATADTLCRFCFHLPGSPKMMYIDCRITHSLAHPFMTGYRVGMQFTRIDSADLAAIEWFVDRHADEPA